MMKVSSQNLQNFHMMWWSVGLLTNAVVLIQVYAWFGPVESECTVLQVKAVVYKIVLSSLSFCLSS